MVERGRAEAVPETRAGLREVEGLEVLEGLWPRWSSDSFAQTSSGTLSSMNRSSRIVSQLRLSGAHASLDGVYVNRKGSDVLGCGGGSSGVRAYKLYETCL